MMTIRLGFLGLAGGHAAEWQNQAASRRRGASPPFVSDTGTRATLVLQRLCNFHHSFALFCLSFSLSLSLCHSLSLSEIQNCFVGMTNRHLQISQNTCRYRTYTHRQLHEIRTHTYIKSEHIQVQYDNQIGNQFKIVLISYLFLNYCWTIIYLIVFKTAG